MALSLLLQVDKHANKAVQAGGGSIIIRQTGWVTLRRVDSNNANVQATDDAGRVYAVLVTEQKEVAQAITVTHTLYWFPSENASADLGSGTAFDLEEVEAINAKDDGAITLATDSSWQFEVKADDKRAEWLQALRGLCVNADGYEGTPDSVAEASTGGKVLLTRRLRMVVPRPGHNTLQGGGVWQAYDIELGLNGILNFKHTGNSAISVPECWSSGSINVANAIGVWLLGNESSPTLDIIMEGRKHTLACEEGEEGAKATLGSWKKAIEGMMPHKPTQELHRGWLEKQGEVGSSWKMRFFVLLSTRKLLYFESESSSKQRGQIDLQSATHVRAIPEDFYNYEDAIEIVTAKRRWILCPESRKDKEEWIAAILPMIGGETAHDLPDSSHGEVRIKPGGFAPTSAARRVSRMSVRGHRMSLVVAQDVAKRGWLERQEDGEWTRRFFVLETRKRDGVCDVFIEYYLDENLTADVDSETISLAPGAKAQQGLSDGAREHILEVDAGGVRLVLAATSSADSLAWIHAIRTATSQSGSPDPKLSELAAASAVLSSTRSCASPSVTSRAIPDEALMVHAGWLTKKGEGIMAKSQQRWFVLYRTGEVHYFESEFIGAKGHKGVIVLADVKPHQIVRLKPGTSDFSFSIITPKRKWQLKASSQADHDAWRAALLQVLGAI